MILYLFSQILTDPIPLQDLKDYMKKAGEITYSTVNRENSGEG